MLPRPTESLHPVQKIKNKKQQPGFYKEKKNVHFSNAIKNSIITLLSTRLLLEHSSDGVNE